MPQGCKETATFTKVVYKYCLFVNQMTIFFVVCSH